MNRTLIIMLALGGFLAGSAELVVSGILQVIAADLNLSVALAGQLVTAYSIAFAVGTPLIIAFTRKRARKDVLVGSLILFALGSAVAFFSTGFEVLIFSRIVLGIGAGLYSVVALSSIAKLVPPGKIGSAVGMIALGFSLAMALGVPIGVAVAEWWSWRGIFALLAVLSLLVAVALAKLMPNIAGGSSVPFVQQARVLRNPVILAGIGAALFNSMSHSVILTYLAPYLQTIYEVGTGGVGVIMLALGLIGIFGSRLGGSGVDRFGAGRMLVFSLAAGVITLALTPLLSATLAGGLAMIILWMGSVFMSAPALNAYLIRQSGDAADLVLGLNTPIIHLGLALGAASGGVLSEASETVLYHPWLGSVTVAVGVAAAVWSNSAARRRGQAAKPVA
ncbi:MFS transporter [Paenibacillus methanolicus]|uniref:MFS transporter n=1 Tax=Paenibacillus methanolicus TaxID=582686 RepID=UPI001652D0FA|nr:MFS transporter [Paenibacillus methanolicus]